MEDPCENDMQTIDDCDGHLCMPCAGTPLPVCTNTSCCSLRLAIPALKMICTSMLRWCYLCILCRYADSPVMACDDGDPCTENAMQTIDENDMQTIDDCDGAICIPCAGTPLPVCTNTSVVACDDGDPLH